ncbi:hypothetical protein [Lysobacter claricitrinus]|uniref:hypothetical protein n=1 Tax=Lysobacter claricitrinus TaxID=3367728 RepID=UPI0037DA7A17
MRDDRPPPGVPVRALAVAAAGAMSCTGCHLLGALFDVHVLREIVLVVIVIAIIGFFVSRSDKR